MFNILKPFLHSTDGVTTVQYSKGETQEVHEDHQEGLLAEKFISPVKDVPAKDESKDATVKKQK